MSKKAVINTGVFRILLITIFITISFASLQVLGYEAGVAACLDSRGVCVVDCNTGITTGQPEGCPVGQCGVPTQCGAGGKTPSGGETPSQKPETPEGIMQEYENGMAQSAGTEPGEPVDYDSLSNDRKADMMNWWDQFNNLKEEAAGDPTYEPMIKRLEGLAGKEPPQTKADRLIGPLGIRTRTGSYTAEEVSPNGYPRLDYLYRTGSYMAFPATSSMSSYDTPLTILETGTGGLAPLEGIGMHQGEEAPLPPINPNTLSTKTVSGGYSASAKNAEDLGKVDIKTVKDPEINEEILEINLELKEGLQPGKKLLTLEIKQNGEVVGTIKLVVDILPPDPYIVEDPISASRSSFDTLFKIFGVIVAISIIVAVFSVIKSVKQKRPKKHCPECGAKLTTEDKFCQSCGEKL